MIRHVVAPASLAVFAMLSACGDGASSSGGEGGKATAPRVDPALVMTGSVEAPEGQGLDGALVIACLTPRETCAQEATGPLKVVDGRGEFALTVPQAGDYHLTIWKDVNGNETPDAGDILAFANNMEAVPSGQRLSPMTAFIRTDGAMTTNPGGRPMGTEAELAEAARMIRAGGVAGRWSQNSYGSELVWGPEIKFQAASATTGIGTNLGGTFGAGSATNTTITYSYKPVQVRRTMSLDVRPDGGFHWTAVQERRQGKCRSVRQEKFGRIRIEGDKLTFVVADGRQTCGGAPEALEAKDETYTLVRSGDGFRLTGERGVDWAFAPSEG